MKSLLPATIESLARAVIAKNRIAGRTITTAESCTGGLVAAALTEIPGSSDVLQSGFVTYSNGAKTEMLGVDAALLDTVGAVSMAVAKAMALGALRRSGAGVAVAISGIAGPAGGTPAKPVGTVVFARAERAQESEEIFAETLHFGQDKSRAAIRMAATLHALQLLLPLP